MKTKKYSTKNLVLLGVLCSILLIMSFTPLGYLNIGPLAISLNMIPVAVAAVTLGFTEAAIMGGIFGLTSFLQCLGIGGTSLMGVALFEISPVLAFIQRFVPRVLAGLLSGLIYSGVRKLLNHNAACFITGFCAALLNTVLFMLALVLLFGNTQYMQSLINGQNILVFICTFVGINAVVEMLAATFAVGAIGVAMGKSNLIRR